MKKVNKSAAPALQKGLIVLEKIVRAGGTGFNVITDELSLPESSAARYLKVLLELQYIYKDEKSGLYYPSAKLNELAETASPLERIREKLPPVLRSIRESIRNTSLFIYWNKTYFQCLAKELHEDSIVMQRINDVRYDILDYPWSTFAFSQLSDARKKIELKQYPNPRKLQRKLIEAHSFFEKNGYVYYEDPSIRRLAAPVYIGTVFCGVLATGGTHASIAEKDIKKIGNSLKEHADMLSAELSQIKKGA
jgi:DNA-binding IclR family transcriptional regulator